MEAVSKQVEDSKPQSMIATDKTEKIKAIWDSYASSDQRVFDTKGSELPNIDQSREEAIKQLKEFVRAFTVGETDVYEFKTNVDSFNKRNNLWGFTATKGQMFFNQLVKSSEQGIDKLTLLLKEAISQPKNLKEALSKIDQLEKYCQGIFTKAKDKRKVPNPGSVGYFLSYFWQIHNHQQWPVMYTSLTNSFQELEIWQAKPSQKEAYEFFYNLNTEIKSILKSHANQDISNWDAEHAFWKFKGNPNKPDKLVTKKKEIVEEIETEETQLRITASFALTDYLIPKVAKLMEYGNQTDKSASSKGFEFEKLVAEIFKLMDFEVEVLGQGSGRNPDAIIKLREENTAFLVDAKAYSNGYSLGIDDRAIKEYINHYCPRLQKEGYKKIGFIIVSNSFKSNFNSFINEITWNTDIKRFILLTSEALLYLLAYKTKDRLNLSTIIESIIGFGNPVTSQNIIEEYDDI